MLWTYLQMAKRQTITTGTNQRRKKSSSTTLPFWNSPELEAALNEEWEKSLSSLAEAWEDTKEQLSEAWNLEELNSKWEALPDWEIPLSEWELPPIDWEIPTEWQLSDLPEWSVSLDN